MNQYIIKILLTNDFIPFVYKTNISYLSFQDVYNLLSINKEIRNKIESYSKIKCENFKDFKINNKIKFKKYKSWYLCLLFWDCGFPKILLKHLSKSDDKMKRRIFVPIIDIGRTKLHHLIIPKFEDLDVYPKIEYRDKKFTFYSRLNSIDDIYLDWLESKFYEEDFEPRDEPIYNPTFKEIFKGLETITNYEDGKNFLSSRGFFSINKFELLEELQKITNINQFCENEDVVNQIKVIPRLRSYQVKKYNTRFPRSCTIIKYKRNYHKLIKETKRYICCKYSVMLMKGVCKFFKDEGIIEREPSFYTFVKLCNKLNFVGKNVIGGYCEFNFF